MIVFIYVSDEIRRKLFSLSVFLLFSVSLHFSNHLPPLYFKPYECRIQKAILIVVITGNAASNVSSIAAAVFCNEPFSWCPAADYRNDVILMPLDIQYV